MSKRVSYNGANTVYGKNDMGGLRRGRQRINDKKFESLLYPPPALFGLIHRAEFDPKEKPRLIKKIL